MNEAPDPDEEAVPTALTTPEQWRSFLEQYGERYLASNSDDEELLDLLDDEQRDLLEEGEPVEVWLGTAPAGEDALVAAEERLGVRFPPSLRGFFLASDGWPRLNGWVDEVPPCDRVSWMRDGDAGGRVIKTYESIPGNDEIVELFRRSVEIAGGEDFWLLDPTDIGPDGEWAAHIFAPKYGDTTRYPSFSALFHSGYEDMED